MATEAKVIVSGAVEPDQAARLAELARAGDRTVSAELRRAVREHLERERGDVGAEDAV
jgi:predicted transcriptional regulator